MLDIGDGVNMNLKEGAKYCKMAADNGSLKSMYNYAVKLEKGIGITPDKELSVKYFKMAEDKNFLPAMYIYGSKLLNGENVHRRWNRSQ